MKAKRAGAGANLTTVSKIMGSGPRSTWSKEVETNEERETYFSPNHRRWKITARQPKDKPIQQEKYRLGY